MGPWVISSVVCFRFPVAYKIRVVTKNNKYSYTNDNILKMFLFQKGLFQQSKRKGLCEWEAPARWHLGPSRDLPGFRQEDPS